MKAKESASVPSNVMSVIISRLGSDPTSVVLPIDATIADALKEAGIAQPRGAEYFVEGTKGELDSILQDKDVLVIQTPKQAGSN